jgi:hypothetical protein
MHVPLKKTLISKNSSFYKVYISCLNDCALISYIRFSNIATLPSHDIIHVSL